MTQTISNSPLSLAHNLSKIEIQYIFDDLSLSNLKNPYGMSINSDSVKHTIQAAMLAWQNAVNILTFVSKYSENPRVLLQFKAAVDYQTRPYAYTDWSNGNPIVCLRTESNWSTKDNNFDENNSIDLYTVILHEIGHVLGLNHIDAAKAVLYETYNWKKELTADDIFEFKRVYGRGLII